ncbi:hypothetical protein HY025_02430 [Candidatus Daviesbacteria bacterium]|nr:hypothetical protein [Candidatus Daviesbacteria bacterium]
MKNGFAAPLILLVVTILTIVAFASNIVFSPKSVQSNQKITANPVCLSADTLIDTPDGLVAVQDFKAGMKVWTVNEKNQREQAVILKTSQSKVPVDHQMIHLILKDGRSLLGSLNHRLADGRRLADLQIGANVDNSLVEKVEKLPYKDEFTYDILPAGSTGKYFANGIALQSTLK